MKQSQRNSISEYGIISQSGTLRIPMDRLREFYSANKGKRVVLMLAAYEQGSSEAALGYYFNYCLPTIMQAERELGNRYTLKTIDLQLRTEFAHCYGDGRIREAREMASSDFTEFLEWLKEYAAENYDVYIEEPKII